MTTSPGKTPAKFGTIIGIAPGHVPIYSSAYETLAENEMPDRKAFQSILDGIYMGHKWQCVEFTRRWLYLNRGFIFENVPMAYDIFSLQQVTATKENTELPLHSFRNGAKRPPEPGTMLIWGEGGIFETTGHVAIVTEVLPNAVRIVEQNFDNLPWQKGQTFSRELKARTTEEGEYWIQCTERDSHLLGWVIQTDDSRYAEVIRKTDPALFNLRLEEITEQERDPTSWLNMANEDEAQYVQVMGGNRLSEKDRYLYNYFAISKTAQNEVRRATNELHAIFMRATELVIQNEELQEHFNIPAPVWPRIRQCWNDRKNHMITGRMDFSVSERGVKLYEYNADSASCYLECAKIQGKWASHFGVTDGFDPGKKLADALTGAWLASGIDTIIHIMLDQEPEETYHALFMRSTMEEAGLQVKLIKGVAGVSWGADRSVVDEDGITIRRVWKTWAWETALDQIRAEIEQDDSTASKAARQTQPPRLVDILLNKHVLVFEPLWTLIPSNKAILPIIWQNFPNHRYLLNSCFELTNDLRQSGYAVKPIAGRCGANITIVDQQEQNIGTTDGCFHAQDQIYQEYWPLPKIGDLYTQISTFTVSGKYAGAGTRVETTPIIRNESDILPLRVLDDHLFLSSPTQDFTPEFAQKPAQENTK